MSGGYDENPNVYSDSPNQGPKKSSGVRVLLWVLGIGGGLMVLMCGGCLVGSYFLFKDVASTDPAVVNNTAQSITDIDPPSGYDPMFSMNMGVKMAAFGGEPGESGQTHMLMLMAFPAGMGDEGQMKQQMNQSLQQQGGNQNLQEIETETRVYTIRGEECNVQIAKVKNDDGAEFRKITTVFTAKDGNLAMLMLLMPEEEWASGGEEEFEKMIQSMK